MSRLLPLPILIPLLAAAFSVLLWRHRQAQRWLAVGATALLLAVAVVLLVAVRSHGVQTVQIAQWPAPFGISLVVDLFAAILIVLTGLLGLLIAVYSLATMDPAREAFGYYPLLHILLAGVSGAFLTGDLFNLFVWFEVMLIASFVLLALGSERPQLEGAIKYVTLNLISSALFLTTVGILYSVAGTLNMADLHFKLQNISPWLATTLAMLLLIVFGTKAAVFPLFFWLPASYHTPPVAVSAVFAGLLTKVGVYALVRVFTLLFAHDLGHSHAILLWIAGLTMLTGVLGAVTQNETRRILAFHSVSQIGYMVMGLALFGLIPSLSLAALALAGTIFFMIHHCIVKSNLFLISGVIHRLQGSFELKALGGLYASHPTLALLFLVAALSLAGLPPLSGFFAKLLLLQAGLAGRSYGIVAVALIVSLLTLLSMVKIWAEAFWKPDPLGHNRDAGTTHPAATGSSALPLATVAVLAALAIVLGVAAQPFIALTIEAAQQMQNPAEYLQAVSLERT